MLRRVFQGAWAWWWVLGAASAIAAAAIGFSTGWSSNTLLVIGLVAAVYVAVPPMAVSLRDLRADQRKPAPRGHDASATDIHVPTPAPVNLIIGDDGTFVGGEALAEDALVRLIQLPVTERCVHVSAVALEDRNYKLSSPDAYVKLSRDVGLYERAVNQFIRGSVYYYWKWDLTQLAEAIRELRALALPAIDEREQWFSWPADRPRDTIACALPVTRRNRIAAVSIDG